MSDRQITCSRCSHRFTAASHAQWVLCPRCGHGEGALQQAKTVAETPAGRSGKVDQGRLARLNLTRRPAQPPPLPPGVQRKAAAPRRNDSDLSAIERQMGEEPLIGEADDDEQTRIKTDPEPEPALSPTEVSTYPEITLRTATPPTASTATEPELEIEVHDRAPAPSGEQVIEDDQPLTGEAPPTRPLPPLPSGTLPDAPLPPRREQKTLIGTDGPPLSRRAQRAPLGTDAPLPPRREQKTLLGTDAPPRAPEHEPSARRGAGRRPPPPPPRRRAARPAARPATPLGHASAHPPSASAPPASTPPASTPPASAPPASAPPVSTPPVSTPPVSARPPLSENGQIAVAIPDAPVVEKGVVEPIARAPRPSAEQVPPLAPPRGEVDDAVVRRRRAAGFGLPRTRPARRLYGRTALLIAVGTAALLGCGLWLWLSQ